MVVKFFCWSEKLVGREIGGKRSNGKLASGVYSKQIEGISLKSLEIVV
jgi:hypothetical protein